MFKVGKQNNVTLTTNPVGIQSVGSLPFVTSQCVLVCRSDNSITQQKQRTASSYQWGVHSTASLVLSVNAGRSERCVMRLLYDSNSDLRVVVFFFLPAPFIFILVRSSSALWWPPVTPWQWWVSTSPCATSTRCCWICCPSAIRTRATRYGRRGERFSVWAPVCFSFSLISLLHAKPPHLLPPLATLWPVWAGESGTRGEMQTMKASGGAKR